MRIQKTDIRILLVDVDSLDVSLFRLTEFVEIGIPVFFLSNRHEVPFGEEAGKIPRESWVKIECPLSYADCHDFLGFLPDTYGETSLLSVALASCNLDVLKAMIRFPIIGIWLNPGGKWLPNEMCGYMPDFISRDAHGISSIVDGRYDGFIGESAAFRIARRDKSMHLVDCSGFSLNSLMPGCDNRYNFITAGRYYAVNDVRSKISFLSAMILQNKWSTQYRDLSHRIYGKMLSCLKDFDGITRVPPKYGVKRRPVRI